MEIVRVLAFAPGSADPHTLSLGTAVGSGNALVVVVRVFSSITISGVSDNGGASPTYSTDYAFTQQSSANGGYYSRRNITDAPTSVSVDLSASGAIRAFVVEISGMAETDVVGETFTLASQGSATDAPSASFTTDTANELSLALLEMAVSKTVTAGGDYSVTHVNGPPANYALLYDEDVGAAGAKTASASWTTATNTWLNGITYRGAAPPPSDPTPPFTSVTVAG